MATNIAHETTDDGNVVAIVAIIILVGLAIAFFVYALPMLQTSEITPAEQGTTIDINNVPTPQPSPAPTL
ncbi:MAG: hypothetical protein G01um101413_630 [Parcubacteria group bacterium Gr01-1014_13]|nr:MAG: hypothetical protein G01um101413_630 [Parcubacteria group bacterium Gr01-1014_13]